MPLRFENAAKELDYQQVRADEVDQSLKKLKVDLKSYYNSAFFREDSKLIRDIHDTITKPSEESQSQQRRIGDTRDWNHLLRDPLTDDDFPPLPVSSVPASNTALQSRRSPGFNMTNSARTSGARTSTSTSGPRLNNQVTRHNDDQNHSHINTTQRQFKTTLITDSLLRHVMSMDTPNALGVNHHLTVINKTDFAGLVEDNVKTQLANQMPDFIYIHLGVNDVKKGVPTEEVSANVGDFIAFTRDNLPNTKVVFSLPLLTNNRDANNKIRAIRFAITHLTKYLDNSKTVKERRLIMNVNHNLEKDDAQIQEFFDMRHGTHLNARGKEVLLGNFRHLIHDVTRQIQGKPPKSSRSYPSYRRRSTDHTSSV